MIDALMEVRREVALMQERADKAARDTSRPDHVQERNWAVQDVLGVVLDRIDRIIKDAQVKGA